VAIALVGPTKGDAMTDTKTHSQARRGDRIVVHGHAVGDIERSGEIVEVLGDPGRAHYRVRWDDEHESIVYPSSDVTITPKGR
jgi:Domain of unknown function (DUF1918)